MSTLFTRDIEPFYPIRYNKAHMSEEMYNPQSIEPKWREYWDKIGLNKAKLTDAAKQYYCLVMFPYPSGEALHVGHWRPYVISDVWTRYQLMQGKDVLYPSGGR